MQFSNLVYTQHFQNSPYLLWPIPTNLLLSPAWTALPAPPLLPLTPLLSILNLAVTAILFKRSSDGDTPLLQTSHLSPSKSQPAITYKANIFWSSDVLDLTCSLLLAHSAPDTLVTWFNPNPGPLHLFPRSQVVSPCKVTWSALSN